MRCGALRGRADPRRRGLPGAAGGPFHLLRRDGRCLRVLHPDDRSAPTRGASPGETALRGAARQAAGHLIEPGPVEAADGSSVRPAEGYTLFWFERGASLKWRTSMRRASRILTRTITTLPQVGQRTTVPGALM